MKMLDLAKWIHLNFQPTGDGWKYTHYGYDEDDPISEEEYTSEELVALFRKLTKKSRQMKPYQAEKNMGRMKHSKHKFCKMLGDIGIKTKASILEAKNADRAYRKAARQESKRIINQELGK